RQPESPGGPETGPGLGRGMRGAGVFLAPTRPRPHADEAVVPRQPVRPAPCSGVLKAHCLPLLDLGHTAPFGPAGCAVAIDRSRNLGTHWKLLAQVGSCAKLPRMAA